MNRKCTINMSKNILRDVLEMSYSAKASHIGSSLSIVDILSVLYGKVLKYNPKNPISLVLAVLLPATWNNDLLIDNSFTVASPVVVTVPIFASPWMWASLKELSVEPRSILLSVFGIILSVILMRMRPKSLQSLLTKMINLWV